MRYGLFVRGKMIRLTRTLREVMQSRTYAPWAGTVEIYEFRYSAITGLPIDAQKVG